MCDVRAALGDAEPKRRLVASAEPGNCRARSRLNVRSTEGYSLGCAHTDCLRGLIQGLRRCKVSGERNASDAQQT